MNPNFKNSKLLIAGCLLLAGIIIPAFLLNNILSKQSGNQVASAMEAMNSKEVIPVDQLSVKSALLNGALPQNITSESQDQKPVIYTSRDGRESIVMNSRQMATLPESISSNYYKDETDGYIVKFKQIPLTLKNAELNAEISKLRSSKIKSPAIESQIQTLIKAKRSKLLSQLTLVNQEQSQKIIQIKNLAKSAKVKNAFSRAFNGLSLDITDQDAKKLKSNGFEVYPNRPVKAVLDQSVPLIEADKVWETKDANGDNITGKGIKIAIIDTGVDYTHPDLGGCLGETCKVAGGYDIINKDNDPMDDMGHGTHVASTATGNGTLKGVAPDAKIYAYKVLNQNGSGSFDTVIAGIEKAVDPNSDGDLSDSADIISMSLGGSGNPDDAVSQAVDNAVKSGVVATIAAGNSGSSYQTIGSPGAAREAITVGATTKQDELIYFSSRGPVIWNNQAIIKPDITAPGVDICAAEWGTWMSSSRCKDDKHISISGTSMATPHVAGAVALIKQAHPDWTPEQIKATLKNTAKDIVADILGKGAGRMNVLKAVSASNAPPTVKLFPIANSSLTRTIYGEIKSDQIKSWNLFYLPLSQTSSANSQWKGLTEADGIPGTAKLYDLDTSIIPDGEYIIKLSATNEDGQTSFDYGYIKVDKIEITNPLNWDVLRAGDSIPLQLRNDISSFDKISWEYGAGKTPSTWYPIGNNTSWDTAGFSTGWYSVRVSVFHDGIMDVEQKELYLDSTLKKGWPVRIGWQHDIQDGGYIPAGILEVVPSDLDNNGTKEFIIHKGGNPSEVVAINSEGKEVWSTKIGSYMSNNRYQPPIPVVDDVDGDGKKEIFVVDYQNNGSFGSFTSIYSLDYKGNIRTGWPVLLKNDYFSPTMTLADVNGDNKKELIIKGNLSQSPLPVMVLDSNTGKIISSWTISPVIQGQLPFGTPSVGNFDDDIDLEMVIAGSRSTSPIWVNAGEIHIYNSDGSEISGWPVKIDSPIYSSAVVGDLNNDGHNEIAVGSNDDYFDGNHGGLYVFDSKGNIMNGWPVLTGKSFFSSPAIGNLDSDSDLEIAVSYYKEGHKVVVYNYDGSVVPGWPQNIPKGSYYSTTIGDVNGDGSNDVLTISGNWLYAWNSNGTLISGFPRMTEDSAESINTIIKDDQNSKILITASSGFDNDGVKLKNRGSLYVWELPADYNEKNMPWPTFQHDAQRTGLFATYLASSSSSSSSSSVSSSSSSTSTSSSSSSSSSSIANKPPKISSISGPSILAVGEKGKWTIKASDPENGPLTYSVMWNVKSTNAPELEEAFVKTVSFTHIYTKQGIYQPTFIAKDDMGQTVEASTTVKVIAPHPEWSLATTSAILIQGAPNVASSSIKAKIVLKAKAIGGSMAKPVVGDFTTVFASSTQKNGNYTSANSIKVPHFIKVAPADSTVPENGEYTVTITGNIFSNNPLLGSSQSLFMAIKDIDSVVGTTTIKNQTWDIDSFYTNSVYLKK